MSVCNDVVCEATVCAESCDALIPYFVCKSHAPVLAECAEGTPRPHIGCIEMALNIGECE